MAGLKLEDKPQSIQIVSNRGQQSPYEKRHSDRQNRQLELNAFQTEGALTELDGLTGDLSDAVNVLNDLTLDLQATDNEVAAALDEIEDLQDWQVDATIDLFNITSDLADTDALLAATIVSMAAQFAAADVQLNAVDNALRALILDRIGYQTTVTATPGTGGVYEGTWSYVGHFPVGESVSATLSFAVAKGANGVQAKLVAVTNTTYELYLFDAAGPVETGSYSVFLAFRSAPVA